MLGIWTWKASDSSDPSDASSRLRVSWAKKKNTKNQTIFGCATSLSDSGMLLNHGEMNQECTLQGSEWLGMDLKISQFCVALQVPYPQPVSESGVGKDF